MLSAIIFAVVKGCVCRDQVFCVQPFAVFFLLFSLCVVVAFSFYLMCFAVVFFKSIDATSCSTVQVQHWCVACPGAALVCCMSRCSIGVLHVQVQHWCVACPGAALVCCMSRCSIGVLHVQVQHWCVACPGAALVCCMSRCSIGVLHVQVQHWCVACPGAALVCCMSRCSIGVLHEMTGKVIRNKL